MPIRASLLAEIQTTLSALITPSLTSSSAASDIFEAYIFSLIVEAAKAEGASVTFRNVDGSVPTTFVFRTSPGYLFSTAQPYSYAVIEFLNKPTLEAHVGVRVVGKSTVLHECDVMVLRESEAEMCRQSSVSPRSSKTIIAAECKFYSTPIPLGLAREFIGLSSDLSTGDCFFVVNVSLASAAKLLAHRKALKWDSEVIPSSLTCVNRLRNSFQTAFKNFKAKI